LQRVRPRPIAHAIPSHEFCDTELIVSESPLAPEHELVEALLHREDELAREYLPQRLPRLGVERLRLCAKKPVEATGPLMSRAERVGGRDTLPDRLGSARNGRGELRDEEPEARCPHFVHH